MLNYFNTNSIICWSPVTCQALESALANVFSLSTYSSLWMALATFFLKIWMQTVFHLLAKTQWNLNVYFCKVCIVFFSLCLHWKITGIIYMIVGFLCILAWSYAKKKKRKRNSTISYLEYSKLQIFSLASCLSPFLSSLKLWNYSL